MIFITLHCLHVTLLGQTLHFSTNTKFNEVDEQLVATKTRLNGVERPVIEHGNGLSTVTVRLDALEETVGHAETKEKKEREKRAEKSTRKVEELQKSVKKLKKANKESSKHSTAVPHPQYYPPPQQYYPPPPLQQYSQPPPQQYSQPPQCQPPQPYGNGGGR